MKKIILIFAMLVCTGAVMAQHDSTRHELLFETSMGNIRVVLYNETPLHRDNFMKLAKEGFYDGILFHRVISNFMVQAGDSTTRHAKPGEPVGLRSPDYTIPAEIHFPAFFHKRGALAAAREGDDVNPQRASSAAQFYFVYGSRWSAYQLSRIEEQLKDKTDGKVILTSEIKKVYAEQGGSPHLDGQYTVFGEIIEGIDVVEKIQAAATDQRARPIEDIRIMKVTILK